MFVTTCLCNYVESKIKRKKLQFQNENNLLIPRGSKKKKTERKASKTMSNGEEIIDIEWWIVYEGMYRDWLRLSRKE